jgi:lactoylglutathione lyase
MTQQMKIKFDMIGLFVKDMKKMVDFYQNVVGLTTSWDGESPYAEFEHEGIRFAFYEREKLPELMDGPDPTYPSGINGTFELAIDLPHFEDVEGEFRRFVLSGADPIYEPRMEPWGMQSSMVADPEGNLIEIGSWNKGEN